MLLSISIIFAITKNIAIIISIKNIIKKIIIIISVLQLKKIGQGVSSNLPKVIQLGNERLSGKPAFVSLGLPGRKSEEDPQLF